MKEAFILDEIWLLTIGGAFQRANIYEEGVDENQRKAFRNELHEFVKNIAVEYKSTVSEKKHLENINKIKQFENKCLIAGHLSYGVSQKLLNLYLKYLWCLGKIEEPPHLPIDSIIQARLEIKKPVPWTKMIDEEEYLFVIDQIRIQKEKNGKFKEFKGKSLSQMELEVFNRRSSKNNA